jgi:hypothetical protein
MRKLVFLTCVLSLFALALEAQNKVDKSANRTNGSVNSANTSVNNASATASNAINTASNTATQTKALADQVGNLFGKKKNPADAVANTTVISIKGANFGKLKKLNDGILTCESVQDSKMKFSAAESIITVSHTGSTSKLLKEIQKKVDIVTDDSIDDLDDGKISITLK